MTDAEKKGPLPGRFLRPHCWEQRGRDSLDPFCWRAWNLRETFDSKGRSQKLAVSDRYKSASKAGPMLFRAMRAFRWGHKPIVKDPLALLTRVGEFVLVSGKNSRLDNCILFPLVSSKALAGDNIPHPESSTIP